MKFKTKAPDLTKFIGRSVDLFDDNGNPRTVVINDIRGNIVKPAFYQINGQYLIGMLRFHCQMDGVPNEFSEDEYQAFEDMTATIETNESPRSSLSKVVNRVISKGIKDVKN